MKGNGEAQGFCAHCGEMVELVAATCDGCSFIYCEVHSDGEGHDCTAVCLECGAEDDFETLFWGEAAVASA